MITILCIQVLPKALQREGTVVVGSKKCKFTKELVEWMNKNSKPYNIAYIDNDKELTRYIVDNFNGGVPVVFENGVSQGSGKEYMDRHGKLPTASPGSNSPVKNSLKASNLNSLKDQSVFIDVFN